MEIQTDILIIGGGPGGLACARHLAENGKSVTLVERKPAIGPKVCAGGITWSGLVRHVPEQLIERSFPDQHIHTNLQHIKYSKVEPIIATVNRERLGEWMAGQAADAGATLLSGSRALTIDQSTLRVRGADGRTKTIHFNHLVGADGANSMVRKHLGLPSIHVGLGLNAYVPLEYEQMEWHLLPKRFGYGYAWIFPHGKTISIGAYVDRSYCSAATLKDNMIRWAQSRGITLHPAQISGGLVNYDYRGHSFGNIHLVGEAAGLASGLTGEGIYPAIVSGRAVARSILDPNADLSEIHAMRRKQQRHHALIRIGARSPFFCGILMNIAVLMLRIKALDFRMLEMAD